MEPQDVTSEVSSAEKINNGIESVNINTDAEGPDVKYTKTSDPERSPTDAAVVPSEDPTARKTSYDDEGGRPYWKTKNFLKLLLLFTIVLGTAILFPYFTISYYYSRLEKHRQEPK
jgi:hypothetical protein